MYLDTKIMQWCLLVELQSILGIQPSTMQMGCRLSQLPPRVVVTEKLEN